MNKYILDYDREVQPIKSGKKWANTRASKETRYSHYYASKELSLQEKEREAIELLKIAFQRAKNPVVSCSFGIDSVVTLYLTRKALTELGRDPASIQVVWNDTLNEFAVVRQYQKELTEKWNINLLITKPKKPLKKVIDDHGGITDDYFLSRKGDRRNGQPLSEKCCGVLKHEPMRRAIKENKWDLVINGLRADESRQRVLASLRDGAFFYSISEWKAFVCRPLIYITEKELWKYVFENGIPYNKLYDQNIIMEYPTNVSELVSNNSDKIKAVGIDPIDLVEQQLRTVNKKQAFMLEDLRFKLFTPRTGCQMCPIPIKYGYLQFMRLEYPKVFNAMIHNLGYGKALLKLVPDKVKQEIKEFTGIDMTEENAHEYLQDILASKPCVFDTF